MLPDTATFRDLVLSIRADETIHREVNHHFADLEADADMENEEIEIIDTFEKKKQTMEEFN